LLQFGLSKSVEMAFGKVIGILERMRTEMSISEPLRITNVGADGSDLFALRYASDTYSPTLYRSKKLDNGGIAIALEPLDNIRHKWAPIMPSCLVLVSAGGVIQDLALKIS
jgi:glutamine amidotransferase